MGLNLLPTIALILVFLSMGPGPLADAAEKGDERRTDGAASSKRRSDWSWIRCSTDGIAEHRDAVASYSLCPSGSLSLGVTTSSHSPDQHLYLYSRGYLGSHLTQFISMHWQGVADLKKSIYEESDSIRLKSEYLYAAFGNGSTSRVRGTLGIRRLPFGLDYNPMLSAFGSRLPSNIWRSLPHTAILSWDNRRQTQLDIGVGVRIFREGRPALSTGDLGFSVRLMSDLSALHGTRLIASGSGQRAGSRRVGLALRNQGRHGQVSSVEWVRRYSSPDRKRSPPEQHFRIGYSGAMRSGRRWAFMYDHLSRRYQAGTLSYEIAFLDGISLVQKLEYRSAYREAYVSAFAYAFAVKGEM